MTKVEDALAGLDRYSVLMKHETFEHIQTYLKGLLTVLTNSEQNFQEEKIQHEKLITDTVSSAASAFSGFAIGAITAAILPVIVEASKGILEGFRRQKAMQARRELQRALRVEFGILSDDLAGVGQPEPKALAGTPPAV